VTLRSFSCRARSIRCGACSGEAAAAGEGGEAEAVSGDGEAIEVAAGESAAGYRTLGGGTQRGGPEELLQTRNSARS